MGRLHLCLWLALWLVACRSEGAAPTAPSGEAVGGAEITLNFGAGPLVLDPLLANDPASLDVVAQLYEGLTDFDHASGQVRPSLALEWDVSGNGRTYTFRLREQVAWVNQRGEAQGEFSADDVVHTIKRACQPAAPSPTRQLLFIIKGCREVSEMEGQADLDRVAVRAIAPYLVEFTLEQPASYFPVLLSQPVAWPLPHRALSEGTMRWDAPTTFVSNGAFVLAEWAATGLALERNPLYYNAPGVGVERVEGLRLASTDEALAHYEADTLASLALSAAQAEAITPDSPHAAELVSVPGSCTASYAFTLVKPPLDNPRVRRALSLAIDRAALAPTEGIPAAHFAPPGTVAAPSGAGGALPGDAAAAQRALAEAGYPNGLGFPPISLLHPAGPAEAHIANAVAERWRSLLHIEVTVQALPADAFRATVQGTTPLNAMPHAWLLLWCAPFPDAHAWFSDPFLLSRDPFAPEPPPAPNPRTTLLPGDNPTRRIPSRLDELLLDAAGAPPEGRAALYQEAEARLLHEEVVLAALFHDAQPTLVQPWLTRTFAPSGGARIREWTIHLALRQPPPPERP